MTSDTRLTETSDELLDALSNTLQLTFAKDAILTSVLATRKGLVEPLHTGGGVMVAAADLTIDGRFAGRQVWLSRDGDDWLLGFYDYYLDPEDEGICVTLQGSRKNLEDPFYLAAQVSGILTRLGVDKLQGE